MIEEQQDYEDYENFYKDYFSQNYGLQNQETEIKVDKEIRNDNYSPNYGDAQIEAINNIYSSLSNLSINNRLYCFIRKFPPK